MDSLVNVLLSSWAQLAPKTMTLVWPILVKMEALVGFRLSKTATTRLVRTASVRQGSAVSNAKSILTSVVTWYAPATKSALTWSTVSNADVPKVSLEMIAHKTSIIVTLRLVKMAAYV